MVDNVCKQIISPLSLKIVDIDERNAHKLLEFIILFNFLMRDGEKFN